MSENSDKGKSFSHKAVFHFNGKIMDFTLPGVMGILNITPDSFYEGSRLTDLDDVISRATKMLEDGAYILDLGAVSTRPGAPDIGPDEEISRLLPVLKELRCRFPSVILSVDTWRSEIAKIAAEEGADMINDISGGTLDPSMLDYIATAGIPFIIMHIQGTPATMQVDPKYDDVIAEIKEFHAVQSARLTSKGHNKIIIDPGFGFGKTVEHNYRLLERLDEFSTLGFPIMAGLSRKSMINRVLHIKPGDALNGTTVLNTIALLKGADILRVHDVREAVETIKLVSCFREAGSIQI